jgi:predicted nucleic-acid-binding protein
VIVGLDTSVVVRLLIGEPDDLALSALRYLTARRRARDRVLVSDWVVAETYYALQHHYRATKRETLDALRSFLATPGIEAPGEVADVLATPDLESTKPGFIDRVIHSHYLRLGAEEVATFERSAAKLPGVRVLAG